MKPTLSHELPLGALLMAVWRRRPEETVIVHRASKAVSMAAMTGDGSARLKPVTQYEPALQLLGYCRGRIILQLAKKRAEENGYIKPGTWLGLISLIISKCSTTGHDAIATKETTVLRPLKWPRCEDSKCLREVVTPCCREDTVSQALE